ncbi:MAG: hypothetical protein AAFX05_01590 [Planctomycetota bacterium]
MLDSFSPGQTIKCTVVKEPRVQDAIQTVARLMRNDPDIKRRLKAAQDHRRKTLVVRSRGKRPWAVRQRSARYALPKAGATWTMPYVPHLASDFKAVSNYIKVESA